MKLKQILEIQKIIDGKLPVDMHDKWVYYSDSKEDWVDIMELDIIHAIRILRLHVGTDEDYAKERTEMYKEEI